MIIEVIKASLMKKILVLFSTILFQTMAFSQNSFFNTRWKPLAEDPRIQEMSFKRDTLTVTFTSPEDVQVLRFAQYHDSLMIKKISGRGKCPETAEGWYRVEWINNGDKVLFYLIKDDCDGRSPGMITYAFEKMSN